MTPNSIFALCDTPLYNISNVLSFASRDAQKEYFENREISGSKYSNFSYIRQESIVKIPKVLDKAINANYCYFTNPYYGNKIFYAYVRKMEYISPHCTAVYIEIDPWQTYLFDIKYGQCFVEREHIDKALDVPGANTLPEPVPLGPIINDALSSELTDIGFIIGCQRDTKGDEDLGSVFCGNSLFANGLYYVPDIIDVAPMVSALEDVMSGNVLFVQSINKKCFGDKPIGRVASSDWQGGNTIVNIDRPTTLGTYIPINKKLLTSPYSEVAVTAGKGFMYYAWENFDTSSYSFALMYECSLAPYDLCAPINYEGIGVNFSKCITTGTYPQVPWKGDMSEYYNTAKSFLQNQIHIQTKEKALGTASNVASNLVGSLSSIAMADPSAKDYESKIKGVLGGAISGNTSIALNTLASIPTDIERIELETAKLNDTAWRNSQTNNGAPNGDMLFNNDYMGFIIYHAHIKEEYARIADQYFTKYGYATLRTKVPNTNNRPNFNFVKTVGSCVYGDCPVNYLTSINNAFNSGITIWHNPATMYDYTNN